MKQQFDIEKYAKEAKLIWGNKYDYVGYINGSRKGGVRVRGMVDIVCHEKDEFGREHGHFFKDPTKHKKGQGCPKCSKHFHMDTKYMIETSKLAHTNPLDNLSYEKSEFVDYNTNVIVTCHNKDENGKEHGDFTISPDHLLNGQGCPLCKGKKISESKTSSFEDTLNEIIKIYPNYDYSKSRGTYKNRQSKMTVTCHEKNVYGEEHGDFEMIPSNTLNPLLRNGCPKCGRERCDEARRLDPDVFFDECRKKHNNFYDYSQTEYTYSDEYIYPICPIHGKFKQIARNHKQGSGCPKCAKEKSTLEREITEFIREIIPEHEVIENDRNLLNGKEVDILIPDLDIAIECDGLIWHSEKFNTDKFYHLEKTKLADDNGIRLIHIFEDEWVNKQNIVKSRLMNILGVTKIKIFARKCEINEVPFKEAKKFLDENHIQGYSIDKIRYGLYFSGELVSIMTFGKKRINVGSKTRNEGEYELIRFCNKLNTTVVGGAAKLLNYFIKTHNPKKIISYCDRRWSVGNLYEKIGFTLYGTSEPSYFYTAGHERKNRFNFRKDVLVSKYGCNESMTEHEWCLKNGYYRIYDCGTLCYKLDLS